MSENHNVDVSTTDWREEYAYTLGVQAFIFGFPWIYLPSQRWDWVTQPKPPGNVTPYAPLNHFNHIRVLTDATYRGGGMPNNDTLYSTAWVDVGTEPVILSHPDMGNRYFTFELASMDSDNFDYVGKRTTGSNAGHFALVGPGWTGKLPEEVKPVAPSRTDTVLILGRTLVDGPADVPTVNAIQDQYKLTPLSYWGRRDAELPASRDVWRPFDPTTDPLAEWKTMNKAMTENPPEPRLDKLLGLFATVGVGPNQDIDGLDDATKRGLARAAAKGRTLMEGAVASGLLGVRANNWSIPFNTIGRAGLADDWLLRAAVQCMAGMVANDPAEAMYLNTGLDSAGRLFEGENQYVLRFAPGGLPKVKEFWSLTLYDPTYNFTPNPMNRYSIGDRTQGLQQDSDGGLTIYIQSTSPGADKESNWLPATQQGLFLLVLRTYGPSDEILNQRWAPPAVTAV